MSYLTTDTSFGAMLQRLLMSDEIVPGSSPSYELSKLIYMYHPLGLKMAESPIRMAQSQERQISVPGGPEEKIKRAFLDQWQADAASKVIFQLATLSRVYGAASIGTVIERNGERIAPSEPIDFKQLYKDTIAFSLFDPLNTAGSLILNQNPGAIDFLKVSGSIAVQGERYHRSRCHVMLNEQPIYLGWSESAFGYVGRSVYQRALYPLKSFIQSMLTDDLVTLKAGVLIEKVKQPGSVIDNIMTSIAAAKRAFLKLARIGNVITIGDQDAIESLNLQNIDGAHTTARKHIIENIATAADMPAKLLLQETFAEGFGEGTEDAKHVARYIERTRQELRPAYSFMDEIVIHRAWNEDFYATVQAEFPDDYRNKPYQQAFYEWKNSFEAKWPNLLTEPDSDKARTEDVKLKAVIATVEIFAPLLANAPQSKAKLIDWACDNLSENKIMFPYPLVLDGEEIAEATLGAGGKDNDLPPVEPAPPFSMRDAIDDDALGPLRKIVGERKLLAVRA